MMSGLLYKTHMVLLHGSRGQESGWASLGGSGSGSHEFAVSVSARLDWDKGLASKLSYLVVGRRSPFSPREPLHMAVGFPWRK
jgi:hypothetical protein